MLRPFLYSACAVLTLGLAPPRPPDAGQPPPEGSFALVGGTLVNPGRRGIPDAVVIVQDGRISCAGSRADCPVPSGLDTIDADDSYIAPGLIDAHVHYSQTAWVDGRPDAIDVRALHPYDSVIGALEADPDRFHRAHLCAGVTAVFDVGGYPWTVQMAKRTRDAPDAPRVAATGPLLSTIDHWVNLPTSRQFVHMRDDSTVRAAVRAQRSSGASAIKVWYLRRPAGEQEIARRLLMAAGDEARRVGLPLAVHATQLALAKDALEAGAKLLVHSVDSDTVDAEFIALMRQRGAILVPTLTVREGYADVYLGRSPRRRYPLDCVDATTRSKLETALPPAQREDGASRVAAWERSRAIMEENLRRLYAAGIPIAMGTDAGNPGTAHGPSVYREMVAMQDAGMPPAAVFASATIVAARAMGLEEEIGSVEPGKRSDLVILEENPADDAANARTVLRVVRNGRLHDRHELLPGGAARRSP